MSTDRKPVICLGDSHTRGFLGSSWLQLLRPQLPHLQLINAGIDGQTSESIAARLPGLLTAHPQPAAVLIFSGSNDCIAQQTPDLRTYYRWRFALKQECSEQNALDNLEKMLHLVQEQARHAKVVVITLPIMVEDPQHAANIRAHNYSKAVKDLVTKKYPHVCLVDFQSACRQYMAEHSAAWQQVSQEMQQQQPQQQMQNSSKGTVTDTAPGAARKVYAMNVCTLVGHMAWSKAYQGMLMQRSWDGISHMQGLFLLTDQIHINDTAARILADLVQPLLLPL